MLRWGFSIFAFCFQLNAAVAYEVDAFTGRDRLSSMPDATFKVNNEINVRLRAAVEDFNENSGGKCSNEKIVAAIRDIMGGSFSLGGVLSGDFSTGVENYFSKDKSFSSYRLEASKSHIYKGGGGFLRMVGLAPQLKLGNRLVGTDKFGHFFSEGYEYFNREKWPAIENVTANQIKDANHFGTDLERGFFGMGSTGVKSYGDLNANFGGFRFWSELFSGTDKGYIRCEKGRATLVRVFDISSYLNDGWDEGLNCSEFKEDLRAVVVENLEDRKMSCPVDSKACDRLVKLQCAQDLISPVCTKGMSKNSGSCSLRSDSAMLQMECFPLKAQPLPSRDLDVIQRILERSST